MKKKIICKKCKVPYSEHNCFWSPCSGCKDGHNSFHKTVVESPEWSAWEREVARRVSVHNKKKSKVYTGCWDVDECRECGGISPEHWKDFIKFIKRSSKRG